MIHSGGLIVIHIVINVYIYICNIVLSKNLMFQ